MAAGPASELHCGPRDPDPSRTGRRGDSTHDRRPQGPLRDAAGCCSTRSSYPECPSMPPPGGAGTRALRALGETPPASAARTSGKPCAPGGAGRARSCAALALLRCSVQLLASGDRPESGRVDAPGTIAPLTRCRRMPGPASSSERRHAPSPRRRLAPQPGRPDQRRLRECPPRGPAHRLRRRPIYDRSSGLAHTSRARASNVGPGNPCAKGRRSRSPAFDATRRAGASPEAHGALERGHPRPRRERIRLLASSCATIAGPIDLLPVTARAGTQQLESGHPGEPPRVACAEAQGDPSERRPLSLLGGLPDGG